MALPITTYGPEVFERMVLAVERVKQRLIRASLALAEANIPYAITGGNAVAAWVATIDAGAVRNTADVDIIIERADFERAKAAIERVGFTHRHVAGLDVFIDKDGTARDGVHLLFAGEFVKPDDVLPVPSPGESVAFSDTRFVDLFPLVRYKLVSYRRKDQVHLSDMIELGLIDQSWLPRLPTELADRLRFLLDNPE
jgi:hypothetical protein